MVDGHIETTRVLSRQRMAELFPNGRTRIDNFFCFPKSTCRIHGNDVLVIDRQTTRSLFRAVCSGSGTQLRWRDGSALWIEGLNMSSISVLVARVVECAASPTRNPRPDLARLPDYRTGR
jgi:hypothetical protein